MSAEAASPTSPPYGTIVQELRAGRAIAFLGAGASRLTGDTAAGQRELLPSGSQLASILARQSNFPSVDEKERTELAKVSSYFVDGSSRIALRSVLGDIFRKDYPSNELHSLLAALANGENLPEGCVFVTTNYDTLLEKAFQAAGKPYDLVVYPADNKKYANALLWWAHGEPEPVPIKSTELDVRSFQKKNIIYKMHGTVHPSVGEWDSFVITEEDYINFLSRMKSAVPGAFRTFFKSRSFLFLGYGLADWNFRVLLKEVSSRESVSWAIKLAPSEFEKKVWVRRNVDLFDLGLEEFVARLQEFRQA